MAKNRIRASAIITKDDQVLLIHRRKEGREYWVFPGGGIEAGETGEEAVAREVKEETGLACTKVKLAFRGGGLEKGMKHPFYFCQVKEGKIVLGGPEGERNSENNWYSPQWVKIGQLRKINLFPPEAKSKLIKIMGRKE